MAHDGGDPDTHRARRRSLTVAEQHIVQEIPCQESPTRRIAARRQLVTRADIVETWIFGTDLGDVDAGTEHRHLREGNGADEETQRESSEPSHNHFTL